MAARWRSRYGLKGLIEKFSSDHGLAVSSRESFPRDSRSQAANPVAGCSISLHPIGHPIIWSEKRGLEIRSPMKDPIPLLKLTRTRGEDAVDGSTGFQPTAFMVSHNAVQLRADVLRPICPPLPVEQSKGPVMFSALSAMIRSGK